MGGETLIKPSGVKASFECEFAGGGVQGPGEWWGRASPPGKQSRKGQHGKRLSDLIVLIGFWRR